MDFLTQFWNLIDSDPSTIENENRVETMKRVGFVNKKYSVGLKKGYETDRGRVYIAHGKPDEINEVHQDIIDTVHKVSGPNWKIGSIERQKFYRYYHALRGRVY